MTVLLATEARLWLRDPFNALFGVLLRARCSPGWARCPALREPSPMFGGGTFLEYFAPSMLAVSVAVLGLQALPVGPRDVPGEGILRRFAATPARPWAVLAAQLAINAASALLGAVLLVVVAVAGFGVPLPRHPLAFTAALLLGTGSVFAVGLVVAGAAPKARTATTAGTVLFMLTQFFAGVYLPKFLLPEPVVAIGAYVPPGVTALQDAWTGAGPHPAQLAVLALITVVATVLATRVFRWE
jgi:ABC-2 type transport system permease protein